MPARRRKRKPQQKVEKICCKTSAGVGCGNNGGCRSGTTPPSRTLLIVRACRRLVNEGYGSDAAFLSWLYDQKVIGPNSGRYGEDTTKGF